MRTGHRGERFAVEAAHEVAPVAAVENPARVLRVAVHGDLEELRALAAVGDGDFAHLLPFLEILGGQQRVVVFVKKQGHYPFLFGRIPDDFGIAVTADHTGEHGILVIFGPGPPAVVAVGETLGKGLGRRGVDADERLLRTGLETCRVVPVHHGRSRIDQSMFIGIKGNGQFLPMNQVRADGMPPMHVSPTPTIRIVLEKQVILALVKHQPVWVIGPAALRGKMELRAQLLLIERVRVLDLVRLVDRFQTG